MRRAESRSELVVDGSAKKRVLPGARFSGQTPRQGKATILRVGRDRGEDGSRRGLHPRKNRFDPGPCLISQKPRTCL
jgi:hypothetical protein